MKVSFALTLDGMLRALRTRLHHVQDDLQWGEAEKRTERREGVMRDDHRERREKRDGDSIG